MRSFVFALLAVACFAAEAEFEFEGNFSAKYLDDFKMRRVELNTLTQSIEIPYIGVTVPIPIEGLGWISGAFEGSALNASASVDVISAMHIPGKSVPGMGFSLGLPPTTFGSYISGKIAFDPTYFFKAISGKVDAESSIGIVGFLVPGVIEVDSKGNIVGGISFTQQWTDLKGVRDTPKGIIVYQSSIKDTSKATVTEHIISSNVAGYLKFAKTPVSPNTLEVVYEISNYQYQDKNNHLELIFVSASVHGEGKPIVNPMISFNNITDDFASYVALRGEVTADSNSVGVDVKVIAESQVSDEYRVPGLVKTIISKVFSLRGAVSLDYRRVAFPAGAKNIIYDPAIGAGRNVYDSASSVVLSIFAVLLAVFLLF